MNNESVSKLGKYLFIFVVIVFAFHVVLELPIFFSIRIAVVCALFKVVYSFVRRIS